MAEAAPGMNVLLVDDDATNLLVLSTMIAPRGWTLAEATSGPDAMRLCERVAPSLILTDIFMPGMNGIELARAILQDARASGAAPPVIVGVTAALGEPIRAEAMEAGMLEVLGKPLTRSKVDSALDRRSGRWAAYVRWSGSRRQAKDLT